MVRVYFKITLQDMNGNRMSYWDERDGAGIVNTMNAHLNSIIGDAECYYGDQYVVVDVQVSNRKLP